MYQIVDANGNMKICSTAVALDYVERIELANGKIVNTDTGKIISAINGKYPYEEMTKAEFDAAYIGKKSVDVEQEKEGNIETVIKSKEKDAKFMDVIKVLWRTRNQ